MQEKKMRHVFTKHNKMDEPYCVNCLVDESKISLDEPECFIRKHKKPNRTIDFNIKNAESLKVKIPY